MTNSQLLLAYQHTLKLHFIGSHLSHLYPTSKGAFFSPRPKHYVVFISTYENGQIYYRQKVPTTFFLATVSSALLLSLYFSRRHRGLNIEPASSSFSQPNELQVLCPLELSSVVSPTLRRILNPMATFQCLSYLKNLQHLALLVISSSKVCAFPQFFPFLLTFLLPL